MMRTLVHVGNGELRLKELPDFVAGEDEGVLSVEGSAVCIADAETLHGYGPVMGTPLALGHEIVGVVSQVGPKAPDTLKQFLGQRVVVDDARPCGVCEWCRQGQRRYCKAPRYGHIVEEPTTHNFGGYADAITLDRQSVLVPISPELPIELATFIVPVGSGAEWLLLDCNLQPGESVAVLGTSRMGLASCVVALHQRAREVVLYGHPGGVDAIRAAKALGVTVRGEPAERAAGDLYDVVVVVTETPASYAARAVEMAAARGRVVMASTSMEPSGLIPEFIRRKGLTLKGGRGASEVALTQAASIVSAQREALNGKIGERYSLEQAEIQIKSLLQSGIARGTHMVISGRP